MRLLVDLDGLFESASNPSTLKNATNRKDL